MRFRQLRLVVLALTLGGLCQTAAGWGKTGHRVVGELANRHLSAPAASQVKELLGGDSMAYASNWADWIRSDPAWERGAPWHYINIRDGETVATAPRSPKGDVVSKITEFEQTLADRTRSPKERGEALKWLIHLIGDLHQPLHVGRPEDRGGNAIRVRWFGRSHNLHQVWDSDLILHEELSYTEWSDRLNAIRTDQFAGWSSGTPEDWATESLKLRGPIYDIGDGNFRWEYVFQHARTVEVRLQQAGLRLAMVINRALAP